MKMKSFGVLIFVFISGLCLADKKTDNNLDNFLSKAFEREVRSRELGKAIAAGFGVEFEKKVKVIGKVTGKAEFRNGEVWDLDKVKRYSKCVNKRKTFFGEETVTCDILFDKLNVIYDGHVKFGKLPKKGIKVEAEISDTVYTVEIKTGEEPVLEKFALTKKGNVAASITGLGPLNESLDKVEAGFVQYVRTTLFHAMTKKLEYAMKMALEKSEYWMTKEEGEDE